MTDHEANHHAFHIDPVHDGRHDLGDRPLARESIPYIIVLPEHEIALFTYTWVGPDSVAGAAFAVFGPGMNGQPFRQRLDDRPVSRDMSFDDWRIDNYHLQQDLAFNTARVRWQTAGAELDFTFEAMHPPYSYAGDPRGCPAICADNRIEQAGRAVGHVTVGDRTIEFDATAHRDHSWGIRDWAAMQQYEWFVGQAGTDVAVHFWHLHALGKTFVRGYVHKQGETALIRTVAVDVTYAESDYWQQRYSVRVRDDAERETAIETEVFAREEFIPDPGFSLRESGGAATIDGRDGIGWMECGWARSYLDYITGQG